MSGKERTENQRAGTEGEAAFRLWAIQHGIEADKPADFGFDFFCQMPDMAAEAGRTVGMPGLAFLVSVRSTTGDLVRVKRRDAEAFLSTNMPAAFAIVLTAEAGMMARVAIRVLDPDFLRRLGSFLDSAAESFSLSIGDGTEDATLAIEELRAIISPQMRSKLEILRCQLNLEKYLKNPRLTLNSTLEHRTAQIVCEDMEGFFDLSRDEDRREYFHAIFGRVETARVRFSRLPGRDKQLIGDIANRLVFIAPTVHVRASSTPVCAGPSGDVCHSFELRVHGNWSAFCHESGFFLAILSEGGEDEPVRGEACFDEPKTFRDLWESELLGFILACKPGSRIHLKQIGEFLPAGLFHRLVQWSVATSATQHLLEKFRIDCGARRIDSLSEAEFQFLCFVAELSEGFYSLARSRFAFTSAPLEDLGVVEVELKIPVCANFGERGHVCWLHGRGAFFLEKTVEKPVGLAIDEITGHHIEVVDRTYPTGTYPQIKGFSFWPSVSVFPQGRKSGEAQPTDWGVGIMWRYRGQSPG